MEGFCLPGTAQHSPPALPTTEEPTWATALPGVPGQLQDQDLPGSNYHG